MNPFEKLGLPDSATKKDVRSRWLELCKIHHPDVGGDSVEFVACQKAYDEAFNLALEEVVEKCWSCQGTGRVKVARGFCSVFIACNACKTPTNKKRDRLTAPVYNDIVSLYTGAYA